MPKITAQAKVFRDWEAVLGATAQNAAQLPGIDALKADQFKLVGYQSHGRLPGEVAV